MTANASHSGPRKAPGAQQAVKGKTEVSKEAVRALAAHKALLLCASLVYTASYWLLQLVNALHNMQSHF